MKKLIALIILALLFTGCIPARAAYTTFTNESIGISGTVTTDQIPYDISIPAGNITGYTSVNKFGRNTQVNLNVVADIWDGGSTGDISLIWVPPTSAQKHSIKSTDASDNATGTGARTVRIFGLKDWDTAEVSEDITLQGTANVTTTNSYVIIHRMQVLTSGATTINAGDIRAYANVSGTVTAEIDASQGQTQMAIYGIPSTQTAYMPNFYISMLRANATGGVDVRIMFNPDPKNNLLNYQVKHSIGLQAAGTSALDSMYRPYKTFSGPGIIKMQVTSGANSNDISAGFDLILVNK